MRNLPEVSESKNIMQVRHNYTPEQKPDMINDYQRLTQYISEMRKLAQASPGNAKVLAGLLDEQQSYVNQGLEIINKEGHRPPAMRRHDIAAALEKIRKSANLPMEKFVVKEFDNEVH